MHPEPYWTILAEPLAFWAANTNAENVPDTVKCNGILPIDDYKHITFFIAVSKSREFISNLHDNTPISFLGTRISDYESYQYKGVFKSIRPCTEAEIKMQLDYLNGLTDEFVKLGLNKEFATKAYYHQPSVSVTFEVQEVFEQTPRKNTGGSVKQTPSA